MATAHMDSIPMILFRVKYHGNMLEVTFQADATGITRPITKHNFNRQGVYSRGFKKAFEIATTGRPGPVLSIFPKI